MQKKDEFNYVLNDKLYNNYKLKPVRDSLGIKEIPIFPGQLFIYKLIESRTLGTDKEVAKKEFNKILDKMRMDIIMNKLSFRDFEVYYSHLENGVSLGLLENYLPYALALSEATVLITQPDEEIKLANLREELDNFIAREVRKELVKKGINLSQYFKNMKLNMINNVISFNQYCVYCEYLRLAIIAKVDNIDYLELAQTLQSVQVEPTKTYDEAIKFNYYQKLIANYIIKFERQTKRIRRK